MGLAKKTTKMKIVKTGTVVRMPVRKNIAGRATSLGK
jgi:hypothetical protein